MMDLTFGHQALKLPDRRWLVLFTDKAVLNAGIIMAYQKSLFSTEERWERLERSLHLEPIQGSESYHWYSSAKLY